MADKYRKKVETFTDFRKLLDRKDIDAVSIATPNHMHALVTWSRPRPARTCMCEKPASHNMWEGRQMVAAARRYNRIMQIGTQSRSSQSLKEAVEWVQSGRLGKILYAIGTCYKPRQGIGKLDKPLEIPSTIHYDLWCGPAEKEDLYRPKLHYDWHWDCNTGNGDMGNQGIHQMDIARWFLGEPALAPRVISIGGRLGYEDAGNTPNTQVVFLDYEKAPLIFETRGLPRSKAAQDKWGDSMDRFRGSDVGVIVQCEKGYVVVPNYTSFIAYDRQGKEVKRWSRRIRCPEDPSGQLVGGNRGQRSLAAQRRDPRRASIQCAMPPGRNFAAVGRAGPHGRDHGAYCANDLLANSFDRMAGHLRANGVDIDSGNGVMTLGPMARSRSVDRNIHQQRRGQRAPRRAKQRDGSPCRIWKGAQRRRPLRQVGKNCRRGLKRGELRGVIAPVHIRTLRQA